MPDYARRVVDNRNIHTICLQDMVAVTLLLGQEPVAEEVIVDAIRMPNFADVRSRVNLQTDPILDAEQPSGRGASVTINTVASSPATMTVTHPRGHFAAGTTSWQDLLQKWSVVLPEPELNELASTCQRLDGLADVGALSSALARVAPAASRS